MSPRCSVTLGITSAAIHSEFDHPRHGRRSSGYRVAPHTVRIAELPARGTAGAGGQSAVAVRRLEACVRPKTSAIAKSVSSQIRLPECAEAEACSSGKRLQSKVGRSQLSCPESLRSSKVDFGSEQFGTGADLGHRGRAGTANFVSQGFIVHNSRLTMKYPSVYLVGQGRDLARCYRWRMPAQASVRTAGAKMVHAAPNTTRRSSTSRSASTAARRSTVDWSKSAGGGTDPRATSSATR